MHVIKNKSHYYKALDRWEEIVSADSGTPEAYERDELIEAINRYEEEHEDD